MAFQVKLFVDADQEIRRFNLDASATFVTLKQRVQELLGNDAFRMFWRDSDNDMVVLGSDDEFQAARQTIKIDAPLRVFIRAVKKPSSEEKKVHQCVQCDGCGGDIAGTRYKCLECPDYDLCEQCEAKNVHRQHNMITIRNPDLKEWRRFFHGPRYHRQGQGDGPASGPCEMGGWVKHGHLQGQGEGPASGPFRMGGWAKHGHLQGQGEGPASGPCGRGGWAKRGHHQGQGEGPASGPFRMGGWAKHGHLQGQGEGPASGPCGRGGWAKRGHHQGQGEGPASGPFRMGGWAKHGHLQGQGEGPASDPFGMGGWAKRGHHQGQGEGTASGPCGMAGWAKCGHHQGQEEGPASSPCGMGGWAKRGPCGLRQFGPRPGMGGRCGPFRRGPAAFIPPFLRPFIVAEEGKEVNWEQINDIVGNIAQQLFGELKPEEDQEETKKEEEASSTPSTTDQEKPASEASTSANAPVERERASSVTETVKTENEQGWTHLEAEQVEGAIKVRENSAEKTTQSPSANVTTAAALSETELKNQRIEDALKAMSDMGFPNEGNLLRRLLNNYNGDVARVLDSIK